MSWGEWPILQVALDHTSLKEAVKVAEELMEIEDIWIEAGTPLIKSEGMEAVRRLRKLYPKRFIVADMKISDAGRIESELAIKAGADMVSVLGTSSDETIQDVVEVCRDAGVKVFVDLMGVVELLEAVERYVKLGVDMLTYHIGYSGQRRGVRAIDRLEVVREIVRKSSIPVAVAGGIRPGEAEKFVRIGCKVIIVGRAVTAAERPAEVVRSLLREISSVRR